MRIPTRLGLTTLAVISLFPLHHSMAASRAQPEPAPGDPCLVNGLHLPQVAAGAHCDAVSRIVIDPQTGRRSWTTTVGTPPPPGSPQYESMCWYNITADGNLHGNDLWSGPVLPAGWSEYTPIGFRLNMNQLASPGLGDFLSPATTIGSDSLALVPAGDSGSSTAWQGITRPTLQGVADLVTGVPLIQVTDLDLPLGGTSFRLIRTRSGNPSRQAPASQTNMAAQYRWWDWTGAGWMASENPILIVDSAVPDIVGDNPRTCWLVLDAHRSIPFQRIESAGTYEAPPRFRARLDHNGEGWNPASRTWATLPTEYYVYLFDDALKYTFVIIREDVPPHLWDRNFVIGETAGTESPIEEWVASHYHDRPYTANQFHRAGIMGGRADNHDPFATTNPGLGIPYLALCVQIEDRYGHIVEMEYCDSTRTVLDDATPSSSGTPCVECMQNCLAKGQLHTVRLKVRQGASIETRWTLLYSHRMFAGLNFLAEDAEPPLQAGYIRAQYPDTDPQNAGAWEMHGSIAMDRIYVFPGEVANISHVPCLTTSHHDECGLNAGVDPLHSYNSNPTSTPVGQQWAYMVRYHYATDPISKQVLAVPTLLKTTVQRWDEHTNAAHEHLVRAYHYRSNDGQACPPVSNSNTLPWLENIFTGDDFGRIAAAIESDDLPFDRSVGPDHIALWVNPDPEGQPLGEDVDTPGGGLKRFASIWMRPPGTPGSWPDDEAPSRPALLGSNSSSARYLSPDVEAHRLESDRHHSAIAQLAVNTGSRKRYYRIHRLISGPEDYAVGSAGSFGSLNPGGTKAAMRSIYAHPYMWQGYYRGGDDNRSHSEPDPEALRKARWIAIIDEIGHADEWHEPNNHYDSEGLCDGLISRRVVEMNPAGLILRDRSWDFGTNPPRVTGGGLGEQYVYETVEDYFEAGEFALPDAPPPPVPGGEPLLPSEDELARLRHELLLIEHRSVGFSAGELQANTPGFSAGLLTFFEYTMLDGEDGDADPATSLPWSQRLKLIAEGIRRGNDALAGPKLYKRQMFYDAPYLPTTVDCQVEFLTPRTTILTNRPPLEPAGPGVDFDYRATFTISEKRQPAVTPPDPEVPPMQWPVKARQVVGPPRQLRPGSNWYFPVEREFYDEQGSPDWSATGLLHDPLDPGSNPEDLNSLVLTHFRRDAQGRAHYTIADATAGAMIEPPDIAVVGGTGFSIGDFPRDSSDHLWERLPRPPPGQHGLNYVTAFGYDLFGLSDTYFPNGRRWARRIVRIQDEESQEVPQPFIAREYIFNDLIGTDSENVQAVETESPGEIKEYSTPEPMGAPRRTMRVFYPDPFSIFVGGVSHNPAFEELWRIRLAPDANGRIARADLLERDPGGALLVVGSKETNELGEVLREREIDGTITRTTRSSIGQPLRRYVGTCDTNTSEPPDEPNMVLLDRTEYGSGVTDAWLPTITRRYDRHPSWAADHYSDPLEEEDSDGIATVTRYDWRMRPVRVESYIKGDHDDLTAADTTSTTLTFLDHVDRPVLIVTYGAAGPGVGQLSPGLEPTALLDAQGTPAPRLFYDEPWRPTSMVSLRYGPDGTLIERRMYDVAWAPPAGGGEPPYQAEITYAGQGGTDVFSQRPGQPVMIKRLDGVGRVASVLSVLPGREASGAAPWSYELARTDYIYDPDGNTIETIRWERVIEDSAPALTGANAVRTRTMSWYDVQKRLIATADLGTEQESNRYVFGETCDFEWSDGPPTTTVPMPGMPPYAQIWLYTYNRAGHQVAVVEPSGARTESVYSSTGRLLKKIENATGPSELRRETAYEYQYGRLIAVISERTPGVPLDSKQRTLVTYGADVVDADFAVVSRNNGLIGLLQLPNENGSTNDPPRTVQLRYNFAGQVAERTDARGCTLRYHYDDQGRLEWVQVGHYEALNPGGQPFFRNGYPPSMTPVTGIPADRIACIGYAYDSRGHLQEITCRAQAGGTAPFNSGAIITQNRYDRDLRGNLLADWQSHGALINPATTPRTEYEWEYIATATASDPDPFEVGRMLLKGVLYPDHPNITPRREVELNYSTASAASRASAGISAMTTNIAPLNIATFQHIGTGRRAATELAGGEIWQTFAATGQGEPIGLPGLDAFGRTRDLHYLNDAQQAATLFRGRYLHDRPGNRTGVIITQAPVGGQSRDNTHSQVNRYDSLQRLIATDVGALQIDVQTQQPVLHPVTGLPQIDPAGFVRADAWQLDLLGNWIGGAAAGTTGPPGGWGSAAPAAPAWVPDDGGRIAYGQLDAGTPGQTPDPAHEFRTWTHTVNEQNETRLIETSEGDQANPSPTPAQNWVRRDANGNVISDGTYYYQYDAWNRLIQVNLAVRTDLPSGTELPPVPGEPPRLPGEMTFTVKPGLLVKHYSYDGLGRLVRAQSPWPNPQEGPITKQVKSERFFYDGIRRIQELVTDPVLSTKGALLSGDPGLIELAEADGEVLGEEDEAQEGEFVFDGDASSLKLEDGQAGANGAGGAPEGGGPPEYELVTYLAREYIWGPGDSHAGVDELLVYFDANRWAYWVLQDAGGDVVAVCDMNGIDPAGGGGGNAARVCGQWRYDAYGAATAAEHLAAFPQIHCGHKALFFDRLDVGVDVSGAEPPRLIPYSHLLVHMRNRAYSPQMGRFMQPDPNATALTLIEASSYHGRGTSALVGVLDVETLYGDGLSLYQYLGSNPWARGDPLGLSWVEDYEGVFLPIVDDAMALGNMAADDLNEVYEGYVLMAKVFGLVQGAAYDAEEDLDWALDWDSSDDDNPRFSRNGGFSDEMAATRLIAGTAAGVSTGNPLMAGLYPRRSVMNGRTGESLARDNGKSRIGRKTSTGRKETTHGEGKSRRYYDGVDPADSNKMIEVKIGKQGVTERIRRQITKDAALMNRDGIKVKWILFESKGKPVNRDLVDMLKAHNIEVEVLGAVRR